MHIGEQIHDRIMSMQLPEGDTVVGTTLVDIYVKCGILAKAEKVLKGLPYRNIVSWNVLIVGYTKHNQVHDLLVVRTYGNDGIPSWCNDLYKFPKCLRDQSRHSQGTISTCKGHRTWVRWKCVCGKLFD